MTGERVTEQQVIDAVRRWAPEASPAAEQVVTAHTDDGVVVTVYRGEPAVLAGRLYVHAATGTVYQVPTWISRPAAMDRAVASPDTRARLSVI